MAFKKVAIALDVRNKIKALPVDESPFDFLGVVEERLVSGRSWRTVALPLKCGLCPKGTLELSRWRQPPGRNHTSSPQRGGGTIYINLARGLMPPRPLLPGRLHNGCLAGAASGTSSQTKRAAGILRPPSVS